MDDKKAIPEYERAQRVASQAQHSFGSLIDAVPDALVIVDGSGVIVLANGHTEQMFGYAHGQLIGEPIDLLLTEDAREQHRAAREQLRDDPRPRPAADQLELDARRRDGTDFPVEIRLGPVSGADELLLASSIRDVTARRASERKLSELAAIVESSHDAIIGKALDGTILTWNLGAERMYGYTAKETIGRSIRILMPGQEEMDELELILQRVVRGEVIKHAETRRRTKDGRVIEISLVISPITDATGTVGAAANARDITNSGGPRPRSKPLKHASGRRLRTRRSAWRSSGCGARSADGSFRPTQRSPG